MAKISVIIPVYNVEEFLPQCLDSVVGQTMKEIEVICIDDGSTDKSGMILDEYARKDSRIFVIHKDNTGYGKSMNVGLQHATSQYIAIIESDDFAELDMLEKLYCAAAESDADIIKANHYNYRDGKDTLCDWIKDFPKREIFNSTEHPETLHKANTIWTCLYKNSFLKENNIWFHETPGASYQDISFALQGWLLAKKLYFISDAVLHYRNDNPNSSMYNPSKIFSVIDEYTWIDQKFNEFWYKNPVLEEYFISTKYMDYQSHYGRVAGQYQYALLLGIEKELNSDMDKGRLHKNAFYEWTWKTVNELHNDVNLFFQKTAKEYKDPRLGLCKFQNNQVYETALFNEIKTYPQVFIYGAGKVGQKFGKKLVEHGIKIDGYVVTEYKAGQKDCMGIPIRELKDIYEWKDTCSIIIAVKENTQFEMYQNLTKYQFRNIFRVDLKC